MIDFQNDPVPALDATEYWVASAAYLSFNLLTEDRSQGTPYYKIL